MSRTSFWILLPFLLAFVIGMLWVDFFTGAIYTAGGSIFAVGICIVIGSIGLTFYDSDRSWWAGRFVALFVFFAYAAYVADEWFFSRHPWNYAWASHSAASPINAVIGLISYGIPALWYVFTGKFRPDENEYQDPFSEDADEDEDWVGEIEDTKWYNKP